MARRFFIMMIVSLLCLAAAARETYAQSDAAATFQESEQAISSQVMSPFCPGRLLSDCPSSSAAELRANIRSMLQEGKSSAEVMQHLYSLYGDGLLAAPPKEGFGLVAWATPAAFLLLGAVVVGVWLAAKSRRDSPVPSVPLDPEIQARINSEIS